MGKNRLLLVTRYVAATFTSVTEEITLVTFIDGSNCVVIEFDEVSSLCNNEKKKKINKQDELFKIIAER